MITEPSEYVSCTVGFHVAALIASVVTASVFIAAVVAAASLELGVSVFWDAEQATTLSAMNAKPATAIINFFMLNMPLLIGAKKSYPEALYRRSLSAPACISLYISRHPRRARPDSLLKGLLQQFT
jgi:hypothetical protein